LEDVTPDDRPVEQLITERLIIAGELERIEEERRVEQGVPFEGVESWLRLPSPSVTYDLDAGLGEPGSKGYEALCAELSRATLAALRECTAEAEWLYAVHEPEGFSRSFRFWPHRAEEDSPWEVSPVPDGDDKVFVAADFACGIYATWSFDEHVDWALTLFGRPILEAYARIEPRPLSRAIRVDGKTV
jgi:hypothetical protein